MEFRQQIMPDGSLSFGTDRTGYIMRERLKEHAGKYVKCELDVRETPEKRRFFEGAVAAYWFYQNPRSGWKTIAEARDNLKLRWNAKDTFDVDGTPVRIPLSTKISNRRFGEMLMTMQQDWQEEGYEWPDPEAYKEWELTWPAPGEDFPPVKRLKEKYLAHFL